MDVLYLRQLVTGFQLWWTGFEPGSSHMSSVAHKAALGRFSLSTSIFAAKHSTDCTTFIMYPRLGLVQQAIQWPQ
jgi:hypothetical protein